MFNRLLSPQLSKLLTVRPHLHFSWVWALLICLCSSHSVRADSPFIDLVGEEIVSDNVLMVLDRARGLPDEKRFDFLADWVLPSESHTALRLYGACAPTDPQPVIERSEIPAGHTATTMHGGTIVSPVFELLELAQKIGRLPQLQKRIASLPAPVTDEQRRARVALELLVALELQDAVAIDHGSTALFNLVMTSPATRQHEFWPETLVAYSAVQRHRQSDVASDLLGLLTTKRLERSLGTGEWQNQIFAIARQSAYQLAHNSPDIGKFTSEFSLKQWRSVARMRGYSRGSGFAHPVWCWDGKTLEHVAGHEEDYLYFQSPLTGDFDVDFDATPDAQSQFHVGGNFFSPHWATHMQFGSLRNGGGPEPVNPPLNWLDQWTHCRATFRSGVRSLFINGRKVREDTLPQHADPWLAARAWCRCSGRMRDVRISGTPTIPDSVPLATSTDLVGWHSYHEDSVGFDDAAWKYVETVGQPGEIIGRYQPWNAGTSCERLLRYHRPLLEDGTIDYDFYYEPGRVLTYPALDRLAFIISTEVVLVHWINDERFERGDTSPENGVNESANRRGPAAVPLIANAWNHLQLAIVGDTLTLRLNGQPILEREIEPGNTRNFGLLHFADQTEARVSNVVMKGNWPRALPPLHEQELASQEIVRIEAEVAQLAPGYEHDFSARLPEKYFFVPPGYQGGEIEPTPVGMQHTQRSTGPSTSSIIKPLFELHGDFDISLRYQDWKSSNEDFCGAALQLSSAGGQMFNVTRRVQSKDHHWIAVEWNIPKGNGESTGHYQTLTSEATGGQLRAVRQGDTWYALFAENDSTEFQVVGSATIKGSGKYPVTSNIAAVAGESGTTHVLWKGLRITASPLMVLPDARNPPKNSLFVINSDGTGLRQLTFPAADDPGHGSPDWSPNGQQIAFDSYRGNATASRQFVINADGSGLTEVGSGCMPTFSPDGERLAFSADNGMSVMDKDGTQREVITTSGWGAQWSPNGRWLSYAGYQQAANIGITDIKTKQTRYLLQGEQAKRYTQIYWNMDWSPDSKQICFKGSLKTGGSELAITNVEDSSKGFQVITAQPADSDAGWHPDGKQLMLSMPSPKHNGAMRLFLCDVATNVITLWEHQPENQLAQSGNWSPDGKQVVFVSQPLVKPVPWQPE